VAKRVILLASGTGSLAAAILVAKKVGVIDLDFVGLISDKDSPALEIARENGVPALFIPMVSDRTEWDRQIYQAVSDLKPDLVVSVGFMRILAPQFVSDFQVINTHPSLLPLFPGAHAVRDALAAKTSVTGTSVHFVDAGLDTGPVLLQRQVEITPEDDESTLHERIKIVERALIVEVLAEYGRTGKL
jgi:phosphoribosylglycinamide formyltransferase-1